MLKSPPGKPESLTSPNLSLQKSLEGAERKIAELETRLKEFEGQAAEMRDKYLRTYADFENYKKRALKDREELVVATSERLLRELLEVKDHLELAIDHSKGTTDIKTLHDGVTLTLKQLSQFLEKFGVKEFHSLGKKFDPSYHEAVHEEESLESEVGSIVKEYQKGYLYLGRLLRPARVAVAKERKI